MTTKASDRERAEKVVQEFCDRHGGKPVAEQETTLLDAIADSYGAIRREALLAAATRCRYYAKHQNFERDPETGDLPQYAQGVEDACQNLSNIFEAEAATPPQESHNDHKG